VVKKATDVDGKEYAIKTTRTDDEEKSMIVKLEYDLLAFLDHKCIPQVYDYINIEERGEISIVMDLCTGLSLQELFEHVPGTVEEIR